MNGPSDFYGDMSLEDVEEFEGLQPDDERPIAPYSRFQPGEIRSFERDFEWDLEEAIHEQEEGFDEEVNDFVEQEAREMLNENIREAE